MSGHNAINPFIFAAICCIFYASGFGQAVTMSVSVPVNTYSTTVYYTVVEL